MDVEAIEAANNELAARVAAIQAQGVMINGLDEIWLACLLGAHLSEREVAIAKQKYVDKVGPMIAEMESKLRQAKLTQGVVMGNGRPPGHG